MVEGLSAHGSCAFPKHHVQPMNHVSHSRPHGCRRLPTRSLARSNPFRATSATVADSIPGVICGVRRPNARPTRMREALPPCREGPLLGFERRGRPTSRLPAQTLGRRRELAPGSCDTNVQSDSVIQAVAIERCAVGMRSTTPPNNRRPSLVNADLDVRLGVVSNTHC